MPATERCASVVASASGNRSNAFRCCPCRGVLRCARSRGPSGTTTRPAVRLSPERNPFTKTAHRGHLSAFRFRIICAISTSACEGLLLVLLSMNAAHADEQVISADMSGTWKVGSDGAVTFCSEGSFVGGANAGICAFIGVLGGRRDDFAIQTQGNSLIASKKSGGFSTRCSVVLRAGVHGLLPSGDCHRA